MKPSLVALLAIAGVLLGPAALAQTVEPSPAPAVPSSPAPIAVPLPPAGVLPATVALTVSGTPATDPDLLYTQIRAALDRAIRPSLRAGAAIHYGAFVPWPLLPLAAGTRAAVNVAVTIQGDSAAADVSGVVSVVIDNALVAPATPAVLYLSDDPEYILSEGLVFRGEVTAARPARLYYYHSDVGVPRDLDVVLTAAAPARVQIIASGSGPDLDVMSVGHTVSRDFLRFEQANEGTVVDLHPGEPFVLRHALLLQGELVAGAVDVQVVRGSAVAVSVVASPAGGRPDGYLSGPRVPYDGHHRHGAYALDGYGASAESYVVGGPDVAVRYGGRAPTPRNLDPSDPGRDFGDYGVVRRITFALTNPSDAASNVYLYEKPLAGPVRSSFVVDGQLKEVGCVRLRLPYWVTTYQLQPHSTGVSTTVTMTDGGSFYPLELGVSQAPPQPYTPRVGTPDGCSPNVVPFAEPSPAPGDDAGRTQRTPGSPH